MSQILVTGEAKIRDIQGPVVANSGVITALDGAANQYVRGDGTLATFPTSGGGGSSVSYYLNGSVNQGTIGGVAYKELSKDPILGVGTDFTISANGYVASFITDANDPDSIIVPGGNWNTEIYFSVDSNSNNPYFYVEVYKYDGSTFTLLGSNQTTPEYITAGTTITPYYGAVAIPTTNTAITDRIAIRIYVVPDGRTVTLHTENSHLGQIVTTFSKGMTSLNNLTDQSQYLTTGTSGTNFNIASSGDTHTFNLPVASATNTGKLSSTDWSTFNNKVPYTGATADVDLGLYELSAQNAFLNGVSGVNGGNLFLKQGDDFGQSSGYTSLYSSGKNLGILSYVGSYTYNAFISLALIPNNETRSYILPNQSGTFALLDGAQTFTGANTFAGGVISIADSNAASYILRGRFTDDLAQIQFKNNAGTNTKAVISVSSVGTNGGAMQFLVKPDGLPQVSSLILSPYQADFETSVTSSGSFTGTSLRILNSTFTATLGASLTANRTITIPDLTGTIALLEGTQTFSGSKTFSNTITFNDYALMNIGVALAKTSGTPLYSSTNGYANLQLVNAGSVNSLYLNDGDTLKYAKLSFNNAADYTYTFPSASGTIALTSNLSAYVPYTGATGNVNLGTNTLTASTLIVDQGSTGTTLRFKQYGSASYNTNGYTDIYVVSNNIVGFGLNQGSGNFKGFSFNVVNVTTNQSRDLYIPDASGTIALTSNLSAYLPLAGGTLTGALSGTSATFSSSVTATNFISSSAGNANVFNSASSTTGWVQIAMNNTSGSAILAIESSTAGTTTNGSLAYATILRNYTATALQFATNNVVRTTIDASGNVGIGTSSPIDKLTVSGRLNLLGLNQNAVWFNQNAGGTSTGFLVGRSFGSTDLQDFFIYDVAAAAARLFISSGGSVGIGTSSPIGGVFKLQVGDGSADSRAIIVSNQVYQLGFRNGAANPVFYEGSDTSGNKIFSNNAGSELMRITSGGNVFINTQTGGNERFNVTQSGANWAMALNHTNSTQFFVDFRNNGTQTGSIIASGGVTAYNITSDYRLKEDFQDVNGLEKISLIKVYNFKLKNYDNRMDGFIAHELQEVVPYAVSGEKDGEMMQGVDYSKLTPINTKAIQELYELALKQQAQIEELKELIKNK